MLHSGGPGPAECPRAIAFTPLLGPQVLIGDALSLFPFSVGQSDYGAKVEVARS